MSSCFLGKTPGAHVVFLFSDERQQIGNALCRHLSHEQRPHMPHTYLNILIIISLIHIYLLHCQFIIFYNKIMRRSSKPAVSSCRLVSSSAKTVITLKWEPLLPLPTTLRLKMSMLDYVQLWGILLTSLLHFDYHLWRAFSPYKNLMTALYSGGSSNTLYSNNESVRFYQTTYIRR